MCLLASTFPRWLTIKLVRLQEDNEEDRSGTMGQKQEEQRDSYGDDGSDNDEEDGIEVTIEGAVSDTPVSVVLQQVII